MGMFDPDDVLLRKKRELESCAAQYESAVSIVTSTVARLRRLGEDLTSKIDELDRYEEDLKATREDLRAMKAKNDKVASNFSALLGEDEPHDKA